MGLWVIDSQLFKQPFNRQFASLLALPNDPVIVPLFERLLGFMVNHIGIL
jgi:hypothetical protein